MTDEEWQASRDPVRRVGVGDSSPNRATSTGTFVTCPTVGMSGAFWDDPDPELSYAARMRGEPLLDELMANAWRPLIEEQHDGWRYRWSDGLTRRANSALAVGKTGTVDDLVARAEDFYGQRGAPTLIQVSTASAPRGLPAYLRLRGYRSTARTLVQVAATAAVVERTQSCFDADDGISGTPNPYRHRQVATCMQG